MFRRELGDIDANDRMACRGTGGTRCGVQLEPDLGEIEMPRDEDVLRDRGLAAPWMIASASPLTMLCAALALSSLWAYMRQYRAMLEKSWS